VDLILSGPNPVLLRLLVDFRIMNSAWSVKNKSENVQNYVAKEESYASRNANGTGPYLIKLWEPDKRIVFAANPAWWDKLQGNATEVIYTPIKADATRIAALLSGDVDIVTDLPTQDVQRLRNEPKLRCSMAMKCAPFSSAWISSARSSSTRASRARTRSRTCA